MLQFQLRIRRQWKCPDCGRTVLTRGNTTSRRCSCKDPAPFMRLIDTPPVPKFDPTEFATYTGPEDADPTAAELVEDLPEHLMPPPIEQSTEPPPPRRGKGYLRAEVSDNESVVREGSTSTDEELEEAFGAGLDEGPSADAQQSGRQATTDTISSSDSDSPSADGLGTTRTDESESDGGDRRRKRRRRRGRRSRTDDPGGTSASGSEPAGDVPIPSQSTKGDSENASGPAAAGESSGEGPADSKPSGRKRRRRRRGRRGKSE